MAKRKKTGGKRTKSSALNRATKAVLSTMKKRVRKCISKCARSGRGGGGRKKKGRR